MKFEWTLAFTLCLLLVMASIPAPALANQVVNMEFQQAPLVDVFQILGQLGGYNVLVDPSVSGQVSFSLKDLSVEEALDLVTRTTGYRYQIIGNTMVVASQQRLKVSLAPRGLPLSLWNMYRWNRPSGWSLFWFLA